MTMLVIHAKVLKWLRVNQGKINCSCAFNSLDGSTLEVATGCVKKGSGAGHCDRIPALAETAHGSLKLMKAEWAELKR